MATKAEKWQVRAERAAQNKNQRLKRKKQTKKAAVRAERTRKSARAALVERYDRATTRVPHNTAQRLRREGVYELEAVASGRPSRRSTRKSPRHLKADTTLRKRARERTVSPGARNGRRARRRPIKAEEE